MRRELVIGLAASILIHGGLGWGDKVYGLIFGPGKTKIAKQAETVEVEIFVPPPLPPEPPDPTDAQQEENVDVSQIAPPSLMEVPGNVQVDSFTQTIAPPPPPSLGRPDGGQMTIPKGNPTGGRITGTLKDVFDLKDLDQQPQVRGIRAEPAYPFEMKRAGIPGEVTLQFIVDTEGNVRDVIVIKSSHREFEAPAIQAVQKWKFRPGRKGGKAVNTRIQQPMSFTLNEDE